MFGAWIRKEMEILEKFYEASKVIYEIAILIEIYNNWKIQDSRFSLFEIQIRKESRKILQGFESDIEFEKKRIFQMRILRYRFVFRGNSGARVRLAFFRESAWQRKIAVGAVHPARGEKKGLNGTGGAAPA